MNLDVDLVFPEDVFIMVVVDLGTRVNSWK